MIRIPFIFLLSKFFYYLNAPPLKVTHITKHYFYGDYSYVWILFIKTWRSRKVPQSQTTFHLGLQKLCLLLSPLYWQTSRFPYLSGCPGFSSLKKDQGLNDIGYIAGFFFCRYLKRNQHTDYIMMGYIFINYDCKQIKR